MRFITSTNPILSPRGRYSTCCLMYSSPVQYEGCGLSAGLDVQICCVFCGCCCCLLFKCDRLQAPVSPKWQTMWCHMLQRYRYIDVTRVSGCTDFEVVVKSFQINPLDLSSLGDEVPAIPVGRADTGCAPVFVPLKCRPTPRSQIPNRSPLQWSRQHCDNLVLSLDQFHVMVDSSFVYIWSSSPAHFSCAKFWRSSHFKYVKVR